MADYTFSVDGAEGPIVVGSGDDAIVDDLDLFDTDDTVTGGAASGAERLRFDVAGGFALSLAGYATITGFDEINVLNRGTVSLTVGQDFHDGNASDEGILRVSIEETGTSTGGLLDAGGLNRRSQVVLTGADGDDTLMGGAAADTVTGGAGDDTLMGGAGADSLDGGAGDDLMRGGPDADTMNGGAGDDEYSVRSDDDEVIEAADEGTDIVRARVDYTLGENLEKLRLGGDEDGLDGTGNLGANRLQGNSGDNALDGGGGDDRLILGEGDDSLTGGDGDDTFVLLEDTLSTPTARDTIVDFTQGEDRISVFHIDAVTGTTDSAFSFIGTAAFSAAGQLRYAVVGGDTVVQASIDADADAEIEFVLDGSVTLVAGDFFL